MLGIFGPPGSIAASWFDALKSLYRGKVSEAAANAAPRSVQNVSQGVRMMRTGEYKTPGGAKVADVTKKEAAFKTLGLHPESVSQQSRARAMVTETLAIRSAKSQEIVAQWSQGILDKDPAQIRKARDALIEWNKKNPESRITYQYGGDVPGVPSAVVKRVQDMRKTADQRLLRSTPKAARPETRKQLGIESFSR